MFSEEGYLALTSGAGLVRRTDRGVLAVVGGDRLTWLQGLLTSDVFAVAEGGVQDSAYLTPQGRMIADARVMADRERVWLDVPAPLAAELAARLDGLIFAEEVTVTDASSEQVIVEVHGPLAHSVVDGFGFQRHDTHGVAGYVAVIASASADIAFASLTTRGAVETTLDTLDVVRIEAGRPKFLVDMDTHTIPLEAGLEQHAISFTKGCYVGQEVIVRVMQRGGGRVAKKLVGMKIEGRQVPSAGSALTRDGQSIGSVTSACWSPALSGPIALGYVKRDFIERGSTVEVWIADAAAAATVVSLPFVVR